MKKYILYILLTCLLLSCFAGCKQNNVTPTDVTNTDTTATETVDENVSQQPDASVNDTVSKNNVAESKTANKTTANTSEAKKDNQETQSKAAQNKPSADDIHGMPSLEDNPTFVSENAFKIWLTQGSGQFEEDRNTVLQQTTNHKLIYYRPSGDFSQYGSLSNIEYSTMHQEIKYSFHQNDNLSIEIFTYMTGSGWDEYYDVLYPADPSAFKHVTCAEVEYHYIMKTNPVIIWEQFGYTHAAKIYQNQDKIEEIIPLLKLEQVTVPLGSDHVTQ